MIRRAAALRAALPKYERVGAVTTYGVSQAIVVLTSLGRIPLIIAAIGANAYGLVITLGSVLPFALLGATGYVHQARRISSASNGRAPYAAYAALAARARRASAALLAVGAAAAMFGPSLTQTDVANTTQLSLSIAIVTTAAAAGVASSPATGLLHGAGRVSLTNSFPALSALFSLFLCIIAALLELGFSAFVAATSAAAVAPYIWSWLLTRASPSRYFNLVEESNPATEHEISNLIAIGATAPPILSRGFDPLIISSTLGASAVAEYAVAERVGALVTLLPAALHPYLWAKHGTRTQDAGTRAHALTQELRWIVGGSILLALGYLLVAGPMISLLSGGELSPAPLIFIAIATSGVMTSLQATSLPAAAHGHRERTIGIVVLAGAAVNISLSVASAFVFGVAGPPLVSAGVALSVSVFAIRDLHREAAQTSSMNVR